MEQWKKILLYAFVPAFIAGFFSIAPKIYDVISEPRAELTYSLLDGPGLDIGGGFRKISTAKITNSGKKSLSEIQAEFIVSDGVIEKYEIKEVSSLRPAVQDQKSKLLVSVPNLHSTESFLISAMLVVPRIEADVRVNLRSKEVLGKKITPAESSKDTKLDSVLSAVLAGISVFIMALAVLFRKGPLVRIFTRSLDILDIPDREDVLFYIAIRLGLAEFVKQIEPVDTNLTYLRMADILLSIGSSNSTHCEQAIKGLKCILLVWYVSEFSIQATIRNIKSLDGNSYSEKEIQLLREKSKTIRGTIPLRENIDQFITDPTAFLTQ